MSLKTPPQYVAALKAEGVRVTAHPGWSTVNRPGPWDPHGVMVHHTGPFSTVAGIIDVLRKGRPDLPGPLCHGGGRPDGIIDLVGWFDANHAGMGDAAVLAAVLADRPAPKPTRDAVDGNANFYGLEMMHPGDGKTPWPAAQLEVAVRYCAAICRLHGWKATSVIAHKEWTRRKPDPAGLDMVAFRARVAERLAHPAGWTKPAPAPAPQPKPVPVPVPPQTPAPAPQPSVTLADAIATADELAAYLRRLAAGK